MSYGMRCTNCGSRDLREVGNILVCNDCGQNHEAELHKVSSHIVTEPAGYMFGVLYLIVMLLSILATHPLLVMSITNVAYMFLYFVFGHRSVMQSDDKPADWGFNILIGSFFMLVALSLYGSFTLLALNGLIELLIGLGVAILTTLIIVSVGSWLNLEISLR